MIFRRVCEIRFPTTDIESPEVPMLCFLQESKTQDKTAQCFNCGGRWPHNAKAGCPAQNRKCNSCKKYGDYVQYCQGSQKGQSSGKGGPPGKGGPQEAKMSKLQ